MPQIERCDLVDVVVKLVGKQQMTMATPGGFRREFKVIAGELVER